MLDRPLTAEDLEALQKIVPGTNLARGSSTTLTAHVNCAWLLQQELEHRRAAFQLLQPPAQPRIKWAEIVERLRPEVLTSPHDVLGNFLAMYQKLGLVFAMNAPMESAHLNVPTGCLTGDAELVVNRGGNARRIRLDQLVAKFNGQQAVRIAGGHDSRGRVRKGRIYAPWRSDVATRTQSAADGYLRLNTVIAAQATGEHPVFEVVTKRGHRLTATAEHKFLAANSVDGEERWRWKPLHELRIGECVATAVEAGGRKKRPKLQYKQTQVNGNNHPRVCRLELKRNDERRRKLNSGTGYTEIIWRVPTHILIVEAEMNGLTLPVFLARLRAGDTTGLRFLDKTVHVHHKDENPQNNALTNLEVLTAAEHLRRHGADDGWQNVTARVEPDEIVSITARGVQPTYDLTMAAPHNNYVANGFVVHNSGKSLLGLLWGLTRDLPTIFVTKASARRTIYNEYKKYTRVRPIILWPKSEIRKRFLREFGYLDPVEELTTRLERGEAPRAVIVGWESLEIFLDLLLQLAPYSLVMDEIHLAKSPRRWLAVKVAHETGSEITEFTRRKNRASMAQRLSGNARRRLGMTATPIADRPRDWWAQGDLIHPKAWGKFWDFAYRFCDVTKTNQGYLDNRGKSNLDELERRTRFVSYKVDYADVYRDLPPKRRQVIFVDKSMQAVPRGFAKEIARARETGGKALREVLLAEAASRKQPVVLEHVKECCEGGGKVVVFTGRHSDCERLDKAVAKALPGLARWMAHGGHGTRVRDEVREAFMSHPGPACLVGTAQAWGTSVSLNDADLAIMAMLPLTPVQLWQSEGRFHRKDSKKSVLILYPIAEGTIDERMNELLISKLGAVADLQHDSDFMQAEADLRSSGLDDETFTARLMDKLMEGLEDKP